MPKTTTITTARSMEEITASVRIHMRNMVNNALDLGADLAEAKEACGHGEWLPWLKSVGISASTAANYMRIAKEISPDSRIAQLPYTKILALMAAPAEDREALADAAESMSAAEIRRLTEERNKAAEAANAESTRADAAEEALRRSEEDAKEIYDKNAHLRVEIQNLEAALEKANDLQFKEGEKAGRAAMQAEIRRLKNDLEGNRQQRQTLQEKLDDKEEEMQRLLRQCDEEAREEEREKLKDDIEELKQLLEHEHAKLLFAENNRIEVTPDDYEELKKQKTELLNAAAEAEERAAAAEAELDALRNGDSREDVARTLRIAVDTFLVDCQLMPGKPDQLIRDRQRVERSVKLIESWCAAMREALTLHPVEGAVV